MSSYYKEYNEEPAPKRNQYLAVTVVAVLYVLLFVFFLTAGLKFQLPPPPEYGIELDMSGGGGGGSASSVTPNPRPTEPQPAAKPAESAKVSTQKVETTAKVVPAQAKATPTATKVQEAPAEPVVNQAALFKKKPGGSTGNGTGTGTGSGMGPGSGSGSGGGSGAGTGSGAGDFWLDGRPVVHKAYPEAPDNMNGIIVVEFRADKDGNVVYAKAGVKGTTISDVALWKKCEQAAKQSKFKAKNDALTEEKGTISYRFKKI